MAITVASYDWQTKETSYRTFAEGAVFRVYTDYVRIMSDVWGSGLFAQYWDDESQMIKTAQIESWEYEDQRNPKVGATVDATEEVFAKARAWIFKNKIEYYKNEAQNFAARIEKGSMVEVFQGRQGKGAKGKVVVSIRRPYGMGYRAVEMTKYGIATSDEMIDVPSSDGKRVFKNHKDMVWAWAKNVRLIEVPAINMVEVEQQAREATDCAMQQLKQGKAYR